MAIVRAQLYAVRACEYAVHVRQNPGNHKQAFEVLLEATKKIVATGGW